MKNTPEFNAALAFFLAYGVVIIMAIAYVISELIRNRKNKSK
jgi:hypothetical protein